MARKSAPLAEPVEMSPEDSVIDVEPKKPDLGETSYERKERLWIIASLWSSFLLGLPIWWYTTATQRLSLPTKEVQAWRKDQFESIPWLSSQPSEACCPIFMRIGINSKEHNIARSELLDRESNKCTATSCITYEPVPLRNAQIFIANSYHSDNPSMDAVTVKGLSTHLIATQIHQSLKPFVEFRSLVTYEREANTVNYASKYVLRFSVLYQDATQGDTMESLDIREHIRRML